MMPMLTLGLLASLALAHPINEERQPSTASPRCAHEDESCITPTEYIEIATKPCVDENGKPDGARITSNWYPR